MGNTNRVDASPLTARTPPCIAAARALRMWAPGCYKCSATCVEYEHPGCLLTLGTPFPPFPWGCLFGSYLTDGPTWGPCVVRLATVLFAGLRCMYLASGGNDNGRRIFKLIT